MKTRYRVRLTDVRGREVHRAPLSRLWAWLWYGARYYDRVPGTHTYRERTLSHGGEGGVRPRGE